MIRCQNLLASKFHFISLIHSYLGGVGNLVSLNGCWEQWRARGADGFVIGRLEELTWLMKQSLSICLGLLVELTVGSPVKERRGRAQDEGIGGKERRKMGREGLIFFAILKNQRVESCLYQKKFVGRTKLNCWWKT